MNAELREWLGLAPADFPVYIAVICIVSAFFTGPGFLDSLLVLIAVIACIISCFIGMRTNHRVSEFTNVVKLVAYPICLGACVILGAINFLIQN